MALRTLGFTVALVGAAGLAGCDSGSNNNGGGAGNAGMAGASGGGNMAGMGPGGGAGGMGPGGGAGGMPPASGAGGMPPAAGTGGDGGNGGAPPPPEPYCDSQDPIDLPFTVTDYFPDLLLIGNNAGTGDIFSVVENPDCDGPFDLGSITDASVSGGGSSGADAGVDAGAEAECYGFDYNFNGPADASWGGVIFRVPNVTDAAGTGVCIEEGATKVTFWARATATAALKIGAIRGPAVGATEHYIALSEDWEMYEFTIPAAEAYNETAGGGGTWNGFSVVAEAMNGHQNGVRVFVRDMMWE